MTDYDQKVRLKDSGRNAQWR